MDESRATESLPLFPLRNSVLYPFVVGPFSAGRPTSVAALESALAREDKLIVLVAQRDARLEQPSLEDLYSVGTKAVIKRMARSEETIEVIVQGIERIEVLELEQTTPFLRARIAPLPVQLDEGTEVEALQRELLSMGSEYLSRAQTVPEFDLSQVVSQFEDPMQLVYFLATIPRFDMERAQTLLEAPSQMQALKLLHEYLAHELEVLKLRQEMAGKVQSGMQRQQREHLLRQQLNAIQEELGEKSPEAAEVDMLRQRLQEAKLPEGVRKEAERELSRLERIPASSPDHQLTRTYLELVLELPWTAHTEDQLDLQHARDVLDTDHYGLKEIKERILEQLAVLKLNPEAKAPILCFVGPPGVGKTSLGHSIARALGRKF
jgi:ATP-dependent Lon protease